MSYKGRILLMCENGHVHYIDSNIAYFEDTDLLSKPLRCLFCDTQFKKIGHIDDTNGNSVADFYLLQLSKDEFDIKYDTKTMSYDAHYKPATYEVVHVNYWLNFDTGEKLTER